MKSIKKVKRKLKFVKWMDKYSENIILIGGLPTLFCAELFVVILPMIAIPLSLISFMFLVVGGILNMKYANRDLEILLEKEIAAMETATDESVKVLDRTIKHYQKNPTMYIDEKSTKRLIEELITIKTSAERALKEKKEIENTPIEDQLEL